MTALPSWLSEVLQVAPRAPGVYLMWGAKDEVVYIGKAKNLHARLHQYFADAPSDSRFFVSLLDRILTRLEWIVAGTDKEALILENTLIKQHRPKYNVRLKDDSSFLHLMLNKDHPWPRLEVARKRSPDHETFGPYESATSLRRTLRVINRTFQLRTCTDSELKRRRRPCLEYQIGRCLAPCVKDVAPSAYAERVEGVRLFLTGRSRALIEKLTKAMHDAADALDFEQAADLRDQVDAVQRSLAPQMMSMSLNTTLDCIAIYREGAHATIEVLKVRAGAVVGAKAYPMEERAIPSSELMEDFLSAYYRDNEDIPPEVLTSVRIDDQESVEDWLSQASGRRVRLHHPQRGTKRRLVELATHNAREAFKLAGERSKQTALSELEKAFKLTSLPRRIECYDISNIHGQEAVGSMVVALDGIVTPQEYRHFRIQAEAVSNDVGMLYEVLTRRVKRGLEEGGLPDLLVVDGGKGQLGAATRVLRELGVNDLPAIGIAKAREEDGQGHIKQSSAPTPHSKASVVRPDRFFLPGRQNPIFLKANSNGLFLLQQLRDEAHRFAITHHRKLRAKRTLASPLDRIVGVGPKRRRQLLKHFGSLKAVASASVEELTELSGITPTLARRIYEAFHRA